MKKIVFFLVIFTFSSLSHAKLGQFGFFSSLQGSMDFIEFERPHRGTTEKGTGYGLGFLFGIRFGSTLSIAPFGLFSSITNSNDDNITYLMGGYGGEAKLRIAPLNIKGGYGVYSLTEKVKNASDGTFVTSKYDEATGWHVGGGIETLLGPGMTIYLDYKYTFINFSKDVAEITSNSALLGVAFYF